MSLMGQKQTFAVHKPMSAMGQSLPMQCNKTELVGRDFGP